jgi:hypothetical protein
MTLVGGIIMGVFVNGLLAMLALSPARKGAPLA